MCGLRVLLLYMGIGVTLYTDIHVSIDQYIYVYLYIYLSEIYISIYLYINMSHTLTPGKYTKLNQCTKLNHYRENRALALEICL